MSVAFVEPAWLSLALPLAGMAAMLMVVAAVWMRRTRRFVSAEASCGRCGYAVRGASTFTCPECGSDLRSVGIARGPAPVERVPSGMVRLGLGLAAWTALYGALYAFVAARSFPGHPWDLSNRRFNYGFVDALFWPYEGDSVHTVTLTPSSGAYRRLTAIEERHARFNGWKHAPMVNWTGDSPTTGLIRFVIKLELDTNDGKTATMEVDPATLGYRFTDPTGQTRSGGPIDGPAVWGWLMSSGVDMPSPIVQQESDAVADLVTASARSGTIGGPTWAIGRLERIAATQRDSRTAYADAYPFSATRGTAQDSYGPAWSMYWLSIPFGLGLYTYGTNWIFSRYKRRVVAKTAPVR